MVCMCECACACVCVWPLFAQFSAQSVHDFDWLNVGKSVCSRLHVPFSQSDGGVFSVIVFPWLAVKKEPTIICISWL